MKINFLFFYLLFFFFNACGDENFENEFKDVEVKFYNAHPLYEVIPPKFDTIETITFVYKERHKEGAVFQTVTEQINNKPAYSQYVLNNFIDIYIEINAETNEQDTLKCLAFVNPPELEEFPVKVGVIQYLEVITEGQGKWIEEVRDTNYNLKLISNGSYQAKTILPENEPIIKFRIPSDISFEEYLNSQIGELRSECISGDSYEVIK